MSNRLGWILILVLCIGSMYWLYQYFFVKNMYSFEVNTNTENYSITLSHPQLPKNLVVDCPQKKCTVWNIPAFSYSATIVSETFKNLNFKVNYPDDTKKIFHFELTKDTKLVSHIEETNSIVIPSPSDITNESKEKLESIQDKISRLKIEKKSFFHAQHETIWSFHFLKEWTETYLYLNNKNIGQIDLDTSDKISLIPIVNESNKVIISWFNKHFLWNNTTEEIKKIDIEIPIIYAKKYLSGFHFVTEKWSFTQATTIAPIKYFSYFHDFIEINNNFIGIIEAEDNRRKKNLWLEEYFGDVILLYNPSQSLKKVLLAPSKNIEKIFLKDNKVLLEDSWKSIFELKNY